MNLREKYEAEKAEMIERRNRAMMEAEKEDFQDDDELLNYLERIIRDSDLNLNRLQDGLYHVQLQDGTDVAEPMESLEEVYDWCEDPEFIFDLDEEGEDDDE